jgi:RNA polymerase sigma factor (sigma-70 family)
MAGVQLTGLIGQMRRMANVSGHALMSDPQLLEAFRAYADEAAFAVLVRRHGPMVLGTCRRIIGAEADAEDAFQATFLVLARKAHAIGRPDLLGPWLHLVACRTARKARAVLARRRGREQSLTDKDHPVTSDRDTDGDLRAVLDQALEQLPETYRAALVLCELQGQSRQQAARALGVPEGTLSSRLARGKLLLARVLRRRGFVLSATALIGALAHARAEAAVPPALVRSTAAAAAAVAAGHAVLGLVSAPTAMLTEGVLTTMTSTKLKAFLVLFVAIALVGATLYPRAGSAEQAATATVAQQKPAGPQPMQPRKPSIILLWMSGGPSQMDTFDLKPGNANGGPFKEIDTNVKGIRISEHLPKLARHMDEMVLIRSMTTREADHARGTLLMTTGYSPQQGVQRATIGEVLAKELGGDQSVVPNHVRVSPRQPILFNPPTGLLGMRYVPLQLYYGPGGPQIPEEGMFETMARKQAPAWHKVMTDAIDLTGEKDAVKKAYGDDPFGLHCLMARRLVERGIPVIEITLDGWDTHGDNFTIVKRRSEILDAGWSALMSDLKEGKLLQSTLIVWMGEFGRTPRINANQGRDHWCNSFTVVLAGGVIKGGQVIGATNADGVGVAQRPVTVPELMATIYTAVGVDLRRRYPSGVEGVNIPIIDGPADPIREVVPAKK